MTKRVSFPFRGLSLPNSEWALARAHSSQNGNHNLGLGVPPKTEPRSASSSTHFSSNHHHHHSLFPFPFPLHPSTRPYPRMKTMATRKRRGDRREDNKKRRARSCARRFLSFFFVSDATWQERGEGSTLPTSVLHDKGRAKSLPHLFRGGWTPPSLFSTQQGEGPPSPLVSRATQRG